MGLHPSGTGACLSRFSTFSTCSALGLPGFQHQFHGDQDGLQSGLGHGGQYLGHDAVAAFALEQEAAQALQRFGHVGERRAVAQRPGLPLDQRDVVLPVVAGLVALEAARMTRHHGVVGDEVDALRVDPDADHLADQLARHRVAVAILADQTGTGYLAQGLDVAVEGRDHRHQAGLLVFEHFGDGQIVVLGVAQFLPQRPAARQQPDIEFGKGAESFLGRFLPDAPPAVLHVLLDDAFLPATGDVAEVGIEQIVRGHGGKARIDDPPLALLDLVDGGLHVVVDAAPRYATQRGKGPRMGVEQHLVALRRVGLQDEGTAGAQLQVRGQNLAPDAADDQMLFAPVELEGFAQFELQRDIGL